MIADLNQVVIKFMTTVYCRLRLHFTEACSSNQPSVFDHVIVSPVDIDPLPLIELSAEMLTDKLIKFASRLALFYCRVQ